MDGLSVILIDVDGVLTDGTVSVDQQGNRFKTFNARDSRAIAELASCGWEVHVVTASGWPGLEPYMRRSPAIVHVDSPKTPEVLHEIHQGRPYVAVGDDAWDVEMLRGAKIAFCPRDADPAVIGLPNVVRLTTEGGRGVVAELVRLLERRGKL